MVRYVYYIPETMEVEAIFDTPILSDQPNWVAKGLKRAILSDGQTVDFQSKITVNPDTKEVTSIKEALSEG